MASSPTSSVVGKELVICANCGTNLQGKYCHDCGEKQLHEHDLTLKHFLLHAVHEFSHLDSKIFATFRYLFTRPGYLTKEYVAGRRLRYVRPFSVFLIACGFFFLVDSFAPQSGFEVRQLSRMDQTGKVDAAWEKLAAAKKVPKEIILERIQSTLHKVSTTAQVANVLAMTLVLAVLFLRRLLVLHLIFSLHFFAFTYLASLLLSPLSFLYRTSGFWSYLLPVITTTVFFVYLCLGLRRVYGQSISLTLVKSVVTYAVVQIVIIATLILALIAAVIHAAKS
jgi:hypothetical protein